MPTADSLMFVTRRPEVSFVRAEGSWLYDAQGRAYLDEMLVRLRAAL